LPPLLCFWCCCCHCHWCCPCRWCCLYASAHVLTHFSCCSFVSAQLCWLLPVCVCSCWSPLPAFLHSFGLICPHVCACLHLSWGSIVSAWLGGFPPVCVFIHSCLCLSTLIWACLSASHTVGTHIIIKKLTFVIYIINLDKNI
jgi:hypothetical protein